MGARFIKELDDLSTAPEEHQSQVNSEETTPGGWPSKQSYKEKAISQTGPKNVRLRWVKEHRHWTEELNNIPESPLRC
jgi:hypothetical protein